MDYIFKAVVEVTCSIFKKGSFSRLRNRKLSLMTDPSIAAQSRCVFKAKKHSYLAKITSFMVMMSTSQNLTVAMASSEFADRQFHYC